MCPVKLKRLQQLHQPQLEVIVHQTVQLSADEAEDL